MEERKIVTSLFVYVYDELPADYKRLVDEAKRVTKDAYAPYSKFHVGAALLLANGEIVSATNQENAAYPSGMCAERVTMFYANSRYPNLPPKALAIASFAEGDFLDVFSPFKPRAKHTTLFTFHFSPFTSHLSLLTFHLMRLFALNE